MSNHVGNISNGAALRIFSPNPSLDKGCSCKGWGYYHSIPVPFLSSSKDFITTSLAEGDIERDLSRPFG